MVTKKMELLRLCLLIGCKWNKLIMEVVEFAEYNRNSLITGAIMLLIPALNMME